MSLKKNLENDDPYEFYYTQDYENVNEASMMNNPQVAKLSTLSFLGPIIGFISSLIVVGLMGVIYHRDKNSFTLTYLIMSILAVIIMATIIGVLFMMRSSQNKNQEINYMLIGITLLITIIFLGYSLASTLYIYNYRPYHFSHLKEKFLNQNNQKKINKNQSQWASDRKILWWITFFSLLSTIGFFFASIILWQNSKYLIESSRMSLGLSCFIGTLLICFSFIYLEKVIKFNDNYVLHSSHSYYFTIIKVLLIILLILLIINTVINLFKIKSLFFVMSLFLLFIIFIMSSYVGLAIRHQRRTQFQIFDNPDHCADLIDSFHQDDIKSQCKDKYTAVPCSKEFLRARWESDDKNLWINKQCCLPIYDFVFWPKYILFCLLLLIISFVIIAIIFNTYLCNSNKFLELNTKQNNIYGQIFLGLVVLSLIAFLFVWIFYKIPAAPRTNQNIPKFVYSNFSTQLKDLNYEGDDYKPVNLEKVYNGEIDASVQFENPINMQKQFSQNKFQSFSQQMFTKNQILTISLNQDLCINKDSCGMRMGILVMNGFFKSQEVSFKGTQNSRNIFFPNDNNIFNDFMMIFGKQEELNDYLSKMKVYSYDISKPTEVLFYGQQLDLKTLNIFGLKSDEVAPQITLKEHGLNYSLLNDHKIVENIDKVCYNNNQCVSDLKCFQKTISVECKLGYIFYASSGNLNLKIPIKVFNFKGQREPYKETNLVANSYYQFNNQKHYLQNVILNNSSIEITLPKPINSELLLILNLTDSSNHYVPSHELYRIPANYQYNELQEQSLILLSKSGVGCQGAINENLCWSNQQYGYGKITFFVHHENQVVSNLKLFLIQKGEKLIQCITNSSGSCHFENLLYGSYQIVFEGNKLYLPFSRQIALQQKDQIISYELFLKNENVAIIEKLLYNDEQKDWDLGLAVYSLKGSSCHVTPLEKWCAYAQHKQDILKDEIGYEQILINKFTESSYLVFQMESPSSDATCTAADNLKFYSKEETSMRSLSFNWKAVRKLNEITYETLYCFSGWGIQSKIAKSVTGKGSLPSAQICQDFYGKDSPWSLEELHRLNAQNQL